MKKVFSIEKYNEWKKRTCCNDWWETCNGLTEEEMDKLGYGTCDNWMIEVEDDEEN